MRLHTLIDYSASLLFFQAPHPRIAQIRGTKSKLQCTLFDERGEVRDPKCNDFWNELQKRIDDKVTK